MPTYRTRELVNYKMGDTVLGTTVKEKDLGITINADMESAKQNPKIHIGLHTTQGGSHLEMEQSHPLNCFLHFTTSLTLWQ